MLPNLSGSGMTHQVLASTWPETHFATEEFQDNYITLSHTRPNSFFFSLHLWILEEQYINFHWIALITYHCTCDYCAHRKRIYPFFLTPDAAKLAFQHLCPFIAVDVRHTMSRYCLMLIIAAVIDGNAQIMPTC
jgi:hypothetical protein